MKPNDHSASKKAPASRLILLELLTALVLIAGLSLFYSGFLFSRVQGRSMEPTYKNSDFLLCLRRADLKRQDIVCFQAQEGMLGDRETGTSLRRIIGLPGDTVEIQEDGSITVNGSTLEEGYLDSDAQRSASYRQDGIHALTLGENAYFVLGDCRDIAVDSRDYGPLSGDAILGRALSSPDILVYILTIVAPLCVALVLFCLVDLWLRRKGGK